MGGVKTSSQVAIGADEIIERAIKHHISDIHIEPGPRLLLVRYRQGGALYVANKLPLTRAEALAKHFKKSANLRVGNTAEPQIGTYELKLGRRTYSVQIATLPVIDGEKITIRLHENLSDIPTLEQLGLWGANLAELRRALTMPRGLILVVGRQANRLNGTLASLLKLLDSPTIKAVFINHENWPLPLTIKQIKASPGSVLTTADRLKILAREQLDVLGTSNISEHKAARAALEVAERSLVLAGLLADCAINALKFMSYSEPNSAVMPAVLAQAFVRQLCEHCRESYQPGTVEQEQLKLLFQTAHSATMSKLHELEKAAKAAGLDADLPLGSSDSGIKTLYRAKTHGCSHCDHTGYSGEIGVFEFCRLTLSLQATLRAGKSAESLQKIAIEDGMVSLKVDGLIKALRGLIDLPTLLSICA